MAWIELTGLESKHKIVINTDQIIGYLGIWKDETGELSGSRIAITAPCGTKGGHFFNIAEMPDAVEALLVKAGSVVHR